MSRISTNKRHAFTLVELLVVIGIIAVLIGILLPSLNRARESAKRVACASLLRQVGVATANYAAENKDSLPPMNRDVGLITYDVRNPTSFFARTVSYNLWATTSTDPALGFLRADGRAAGSAELFDQDNGRLGSNIGRLIEKGYMKGDFQKLVACPSATPDVIDYAGDPANYAYNVHFAARTTDNVTYYVGPWWKKLSKYGKAPKGEQSGGYSVSGAGGGVVSTPVFYDRKFALAVDPIATFSDGTVANTGASSHFMGASRAYNLLYADGSVSTAVVPGGLNRTLKTRLAGFLDNLGWAESIASGTKVYGPNAEYVVLPINP